MSVFNFASRMFSSPGQFRSADRQRAVTVRPLPPSPQWKMNSIQFKSIVGVIWVGLAEGRRTWHSSMFRVIVVIIIKMEIAWLYPWKRPFLFISGWDVECRAQNFRAPLNNRMEFSFQCRWRKLERKLPNIIFRKILSQRKRILQRIMENHGQGNSGTAEVNISAVPLPFRSSLQFTSIKVSK